MDKAGSSPAEAVTKIHFSVAVKPDAAIQNPRPNRGHLIRRRDSSAHGPRSLRHQRQAHEPVTLQPVR